jgi:uncharacterized protein YjdB
MIRFISITIMLVFFNACSESIETTSLESISYTPKQDYLVKDRETDIKATGNYSDGSTKDKTSALIWKSTDTTKASISYGEVSALSVGNVNISYETVDTLPSGDAIIKEDIAFEVVDKQSTSINITQGDMYKNQTAQLDIGVIFNINGVNVSLSLSDLNITSDDPTVISVSENYTVKALKEGSANITARDDISGVNNTISVTVLQSPPTSIRVNKDTDDYINDSFNVGNFMQLKATGKNDYGQESDMTDEVTWRSSNVNIVTVDEFGEAEAISVGEVIITATKDSLISNDYTLTVSQ